MKLINWSKGDESGNGKNSEHELIAYDVSDTLWSILHMM